MNTKLNGKQNSIGFKVGNPTYNSTNTMSGTVVWIRQWGAVVHLHYWIKFSNKLTDMYNSYEIATGVPPALYSAFSSATAIDDEKADGILDVGGSGILTIQVRSTMMANKIITGGFTYIAKSAV